MHVAAFPNIFSKRSIYSHINNCHFNSHGIGKEKNTRNLEQGNLQILVPIAEVTCTFVISLHSQCGVYIHNIYKHNHIRFINKQIMSVIKHFTYLLYFSERVEQLRS